MEGYLIRQMAPQLLRLLQVDDSSNHRTGEFILADGHVGGPCVEQRKLVYRRREEEERGGGAEEGEKCMVLTA